MAIGQWLEQLRASREPDLAFRGDGSELVLFTQAEHFHALERGRGGELALAQFVHLKMLAEQGLAESIANGFVLAPDDAVRLEPDLRRLFSLPDPWPGSMELKTEGTTASAAFRMAWELVNTDGGRLARYRLDGPLLRIGEQRCFLPSPPQWQALSAVANHQAMDERERCEYRNLLAIHRIHHAVEAGLDADLRHFDAIRTVVPEQVAAAVTVEPGGDLRLDPAFGGDLSTDAVAARLGQIGPDDDRVQSLRVEDTIVLLDPERLAKVQEIIRHRRIPKAQAEQFFKTPSAFLDAALVDMDEGYSLRVRGMTEFRQAYFGDTEASEIDWLDRGGKLAAQPIGPGELSRLITDVDDLERFREQNEDARRTGATELQFDGSLVDIQDRGAIEQALKDLERELRQEKPVVDDQEPLETTEQTKIVVVDAALNDDDLDVGETSPEEHLPYGGPLDWTAYRRQPFPYQEDGVRWLLGLAANVVGAESRDSAAGALLADDMGLGKTFMSLVGIQEFYRLCEQRDQLCKPVLVVAPLSLLEGWRQEVADSFNDSPFDDIAILHGDADLSRFRVDGRGIETAVQDLDSDPSQALLSLKVGADFGSERLDLPKRLVLTNYKTLANYQFSLCRVDWSFAILDEAQNTKNPNAQQTRAAKAIKAQFRLMVTGTPVENSLTDFWCVMDTARPGLLDSYQAFRKQYVLPLLRADSDLQQVREATGRALRQKVNGLMLRRMKEDQLEGLPAKTIHSGVAGSDGRQQYHEAMACHMTEHQHQVYDSVVSATLTDLEQQREGGGNPVLVGLMRLRDVSLHPDLLTRAQLSLPDSAAGCREECLRSGKLAALLAILEEIRGSGEKALIFVINKRLQAFLSHALGRLFEIPVPIINGDTKAVAKNKATRTRQRIIAEFQQASGFGLLVMSPVAAGVGLTITAANNVIHLERHWNPAKEDQATDRVYRIGQQRDVNVYLPILLHPTKDSFDLNLHRLLSRKVDLKDAVVTSQDIRPEEMADSGLFGEERPASNSRLLLDDVVDMEWETFEALVAELLVLEYSGDAQLTRRSNDKGCDVVLRSPEKNLLVQCKATAERQLRGDSFVREVQSARTYYQAKLNEEFPNLGVFTNARSYSKDGKQAAKLYGVDLFTFDWLKKSLLRHSVDRAALLRRLDRNRLTI
jgi:SNF2 family DNA or RNA helicase